MSLRDQIEAHYALPADSLGDEARASFDALMAELEAGRVRAAEPGPDGWRVNGWVKKGILLAFKIGVIVESPGSPSPFTDKDTCLLYTSDAADE